MAGEQVNDNGEAHGPYSMTTGENRKLPTLVFPVVLTQSTIKQVL